MKITDFSLRRPVTTVMIFFSMVLLGITASRFLPLEYFPEVQFPGIFIQIPYTDSNAEEIEREITRPVEEVLATMSGIQRMRSNTDDQSATIILFFGWDQNAKLKGIEAREKIDAIRHLLPDDLRRIFVFTGSTSDQPLLELRISSNRDLSDAYDLLDRKLKRPIEVIDGVSKVQLHGVNKKQIQIQLDAGRVAAHRIDLNQLGSMLARQNFSLTAGELTSDSQRLRIKPIGEYQDIEQIRNLIVNDAGVRLGDIANVVLEQATALEARHLDRTFAVGMNIQRESTANLVDVTGRVLDKLAEIEKDPDFDGITLYAMDNQAEGIETSLSDIAKSGLIGFVLSLIVLYFFLRQVAVTLIVALAVPFSLLITLAFMFLFDLSLNILSLMGLMLAIGMLVDNAVVITESIFREQEKNPERPQYAIRQGVKQVWLAVFAGTVTTAIVFLPNIIGEKIDITVFLSHVAITICIALVASLFIAITVIPLLLSKMNIKQTQKKSRIISWLQKRYKATLGWCLNRPAISGVIAFVVLIAGFMPAVLQLVEFDMFPQNDSRRLFLPYHINGQYTIERVEESVNKLEAFLYEHKEELDIDSVYSYYTNNRAESTLLLKKDDEATKSVAEIREFVEANMPKIAIGAPTFDRNRTGNQDGLQVYLRGESTDVLVELSQEASRLLEALPEVENARSEVTGSNQEIQVVVDRQKAQNLGVDSRQVAQMISTAMRGQDLRSFRDTHGETEIRLMFGASERRSLADLGNMPITRPGQESVPLSAIADFKVTTASNNIQRIERNTTIAITADLKDATVDEARETIEQVMDRIALPPGYSWSFGAGFDREEQAGNIMLVNMLLALMMIYVVMAALFESLLFPTAVIFSIFYAVGGVFWFFVVTGTTFSFMATIGILVLMGVVVNNGIVLIDHINNLRKEGLPRNHAILQAGHDRLRPILMTAGTTILGLIPLSMGDVTIGGDDGAPPYFPMARAVIGGLAYSTLTSLIALPLIYLGLDNLSRYGRHIWHKSSTSSRRILTRSN